MEGGGMADLAFARTDAEVDAVGWRFASRSLTFR